LQDSLTPERPVAIKLLPPEFGTSQGFRKRFRRDAMATQLKGVLSL